MLTLLVASLLTFNLAAAQMRVTTPRALAEQLTRRFPDGIIIGTTATFGAPHYGTKLVGRLIYREDVSSMHCKPGYFNVTKDLPALDAFDGNVASLPTAFHYLIIVVDRGVCTFVTKVKVAQEEYSATAVVVVDSKGSSATWQDIQYIIMADDLYGRNVYIPSILIDHETGQLLKDYIKQADMSNEEDEKTVYGTLEWGVSEKDVVIVDFWTYASSQEGEYSRSDHPPSLDACLAG